MRMYKTQTSSTSATSGTVTDESIIFVNNAANNVSSTKHGFTPILGNDPRYFLRDFTGSANWSYVWDNIIEMQDVTTNNTSTTKHGFCPKLNGYAGSFLNGVGSWATPPTGGGGSATVVGVAPIGGVMGWLNNITGVPALLPEWIVLNGGTISDATSPLNGQTYPNLNGSGGNIQRFLRGATTAGATNGSDSHSHLVTVYGDTGNGASASVTVDTNLDASTTDVAAVCHYHSLSSASTTTAVESSLPSYYEAVWIMRFK